MNERLVESVVQTILAMSAEEQALIDKTLFESRRNSSAHSCAETSVAANGDGRDHEASPDREAATATDTSQDISTEMDVASQQDKPLTENSFLRTALSLRLDGPKDWSANVDHYLYGAPKQNE